jgi:hypothetical protein
MVFIVQNTYLMCKSPKSISFCCKCSNIYPYRKIYAMIMHIIIEGERKKYEKENNWNFD